MNEIRPLGITLSRQQLWRLQEKARTLDLNEGGYYDGRGGCCNVWCGPDEKPDVWDVPIDRGALDFPRSFVGTLTWEWLDDSQVSLHVEACPYDLMDRNRPGQRWCGELRELTLEQKKSCLDWLETMSRKLIDLVLADPASG